MADRDTDPAPTRVIMWGLPRTISSALTKCLSAIDGLEVWFEPYCYSSAAAIQYKLATGKDIPMVYEGNEEAFVTAAKDLSHIVGCKLEPNRLPYATVKEKLEQTKSKLVFVKDMAFGVLDERTRKNLPAGYKHVFLLRHPVRTYVSYRKATYQQLMIIGDLKGEARDIDKFNLEVDDNVLPSSTFFKDLHSLWNYIRDAGIDQDPIVLDADDLLLNPSEMLPKFCRAIGFPYSESLLQWDASTDVLDTWNAAGDSVLKGFITFYKTAMQSSCFLPPSKPLPREQLHADVIRLSEASMKYYDEMCKHKI